MNSLGALGETGIPGISVVQAAVRQWLHNRRRDKLGISDGSASRGRSATPVYGSSLRHPYVNDTAAVFTINTCKNLRYITSKNRPIDRRKKGRCDAHFKMAHDVSAAATGLSGPG